MPRCLHEALEACKSRKLETGSTYRDCIQDSVVVGTFTGAASYCTAGEPQQIAGANTGCGWDVRL